MNQLKDRVAIVTGGARGIGRAYCLALARQGATVIVADIESSDSVVREIELQGGEAMAVRVDVSDEASTSNMSQTILDRCGRIDILVNNAAHFRDVEQASFDQLSVEDWDRTFAVNVRGTWLCSRSVYPAMRAGHFGRIINISSMTVWKGTPRFLQYVASKAAIIGLTRALASELGNDNITVNSVVPDYIPHDLGRPELVDARNVADRAIKRTSVPDDMVGIVVFLSTEDASFITGQSILVNGGARFN